jgi:hypothetical protein
MHEVYINNYEKYCSSTAVSELTAVLGGNNTGKAMRAK